VSKLFFLEKNSPEHGGKGSKDKLELQKKGYPEEEKPRRHTEKECGEGEGSGVWKRRGGRNLKGDGVPKPACKKTIIGGKVGGNSSRGEIKYSPFLGKGKRGSVTDRLKGKSKMKAGEVTRSRPPGKGGANHGKKYDDAVGSNTIWKNPRRHIEKKAHCCGAAVKTT